jgi:hypothetical protein
MGADDGGGHSRVILSFMMIFLTNGIVVGALFFFQITFFFWEMSTANHL